MERQTQLTSYSQDWPAYNRAQMNEKLLFMQVLEELLNYVKLPKEKKKVGRRPIPLRDKIFYIAMHQYCGLSSRRVISDLKMAKLKAYIEKAPHFNTLLNCYKDGRMTPILKHLVNISGLPLAEVETDFAVDSSGFSTSLFENWFSIRYKRHSERRKWKKVHLTCGVKTNIITAVNITDGHRPDCPELPNLVKTTSKVYNVREVSADMGYSARYNFDAVAQEGGLAFIPFKKNTRYKQRGHKLWKDAYIFFTLNREEYMRHYHKRSNVESTFNMLKRKFGNHLRTRTDTAQVNEILARCLCHNICVLIQEAYENNILVDFQKCANYPLAQK